MVEFLGRVKDRPSKIRDAALQSKQMGNRVNKSTNMEGRVQFDVLQVRFKSYRNVICHSHIGIGLRIRLGSERPLATWAVDLDERYLKKLLDLLTFAENVGMIKLIAQYVLIQ